MFHPLISSDRPAEELPKGDEPVPRAHHPGRVEDAHGDSTQIRQGGCQPGMRERRDEMEPRKS